MKRAFALLVIILVVDLVSAQNLVFYQRPEYTFSEYQNFYAENLGKSTETYQLKGNVKSVTIMLVDRTFDSASYKSAKMEEIKNYFETYKFEFLSTNKLQTYESKIGKEYYENTIYVPKIDTTTEITNYFFTEDNYKLLKIIKTHFDSYGFHGKTTTEKDFDSTGFLNQETAFNIRNSSNKNIYYVKKYVWNKQRNAVDFYFNYYSPDKVEQGKLSFKGMSYKRISYTDTTIGTGFFITGESITFDKNGNIVLITSFEEDMRSSLPNNYTISYKYNEDNELIEILKNGSFTLGFYHNEKTTFQYDNFDSHGNWREITIITTDDNGRFSELKYNRDILYY